MNVSTTCDRLWRKRLNELTHVWPEFIEGRTSGLHKTRVATRRIREALPIVGTAAAPSKVRKLNRKIRALTRYLGPIRELDVELELLDDRSRTHAASGRALEVVRRTIAAERQALRKELAENVPVGDLKRLVRRLERVARKSAKKDGDWRSALAARLARRGKALSSAVEDAGPLYAPDRIHEVRIAVKKLRYALEIAQDAGVAGASVLVRMLKRHQERLGHLHDLEMLLRRVREAEASGHLAPRVNDLTGYADALERECRRLHAGFVEHRGELGDVCRQVRQQIIPALTLPHRAQARVAVASPTDPVRSRARRAW